MRPVIGHEHCTATVCSADDPEGGCPVGEMETSLDAIRRAISDIEGDEPHIPPLADRLPLSDESDRLYP